MRFNPAFQPVLLPRLFWVPGALQMERRIAYWCGTGSICSRYFASTVFFIWRCRLHQQVVYLFALILYIAWLARFLDIRQKADLSEAKSSKKNGYACTKGKKRKSERNCEEYYIELLELS